MRVCSTARQRRSIVRKLMRIGTLALLAAFVKPGQVAAAEPPAAPECKNAGVTVSFARGSTEIDTNGRGALAGVAAWLQNSDQRTVRLAGFADRTGGATGNRRLSEKRAQAAKEYLVARGIAPDRVMVFGHGEALDRPLPIGSEGRVVVVTACDVPKPITAEPPAPPPEPAPAAEPAPAPAPAAPAPPFPTRPPSSR